MTRGENIRSLLERSKKLIDNGVRTERLMQFESFVVPSLAMSDEEIELEFADEQLVEKLRAFIDEGERRGFGSRLVDLKPKGN